MPPAVTQSHVLRQFLTQTPSDKEDEMFNNRMKESQAAIYWISYPISNYFCATSYFLIRIYSHIDIFSKNISTLSILPYPRIPLTYSRKLPDCARVQKPLALAASHSKLFKWDYKTCRFYTLTAIDNAGYNRGGKPNWWKNLYFRWRSVSDAENEIDYRRTVQRIVRQRVQQPHADSNDTSNDTSNEKSAGELHDASSRSPGSPAQTAKR